MDINYYTNPLFNHLLPPSKNHPIKEPPQKEEFKKHNTVNLINQVIKRREEKKKTKPIKEREETFLYLKSRAEPGKQKKAPTNETTDFQKESRKEITLYVFIIIALVIAITTTIYIIIKPYI